MKQSKTKGMLVCERSLLVPVLQLKPLNKPETFSVCRCNVSFSAGAPSDEGPMLCNSWLLRPSYTEVGLTAYRSHWQAILKVEQAHY